MEFGRLEDIRDVDFGLAPDAPANGRVLARGSGAGSIASVVRIGLAGWSSKGFLGRLYPPGTRSKDFLARHARVFPTNELNSTYYGVSRDRIERWSAAVPASFRFCPKLPSSITQEAQLAGAEGEMEAFLTAIEGFGTRLGRVWGTLAPGFGPDRLGVLEAFVERFAGRAPLAFELRHPAWFANPGALDAACACFEAHGVVAVVCDTAGRRDVVHMRLTAPEVFVRFVGNAPHPSDYERLDAWAERIASWQTAGLERAWMFLHQKHDPDAVEIARHFARRLAVRTGVDPLPELASIAARRPAIQGELF